jgi:hypothetical protein
MGAKRVKVYTPHADGALYGVILFSKLYSGARGPVTRSYNIVIPSKYVSAAKGGRISTVFELYRVRAASGGEAAELRPKAWVLWMSDTPF